jgi:hypothetical protein
MGYIREAKKAGVYEASFERSREEREATRTHREALYKGQIWISNDGEGVRFAYTETSLPLLDVHIEAVPDISDTEA